MKKILVITDSLGLPRPKPEVVNYTETWVSLLTELYKVHQLSIGGGTIAELLSQIEYVKMFNPDYVIVQSGIVDCAPRALTKFESDFLNNFLATRKFLKFYLTKNRLVKLRRKRNCTYTSLENYNDNVEALIREFGNKLYFVGIVPANLEYEKSVPGVSKNIEKYNNVIRDKLSSNFISLEDFSQEDIMSDYIHLSKMGHQHLFNKIVKLLPVIS